MGPVLINIFINDIDEGVEGTLNKFADDTKQSSVVNAPEEHNAIQRDLGTLKNWVHGNLTF